MDSEEVHYTTMEAIMDADDRERERRAIRDKQFDAMVELLEDSRDYIAIRNCRIWSRRRDALLAEIDDE